MWCNGQTAYNKWRGNGSIPFMDFSYHNVDVMVGLIAVLCFIHYA